MYITKVELENIKSHADSTYEFQRGTTAITGENGAGKTSIIEAIAWTLFDLLDYKKQDFVKRGAKKGVARITFESGLDERLYQVVRDTGTAYYVIDTALKVRIADKKEDVTRFLWQHLGVEPGTDLETLFRRAIGVPQGTFTAIFLESTVERKRAFDKLLKVEEYRRSSEELLKTSRYLDDQIQTASINIARAEGQLGRFEVVSAEKEDVIKKAKVAAADLETRKRSIEAKSNIVDELTKLENVVREARLNADAAAAKKNGSELSLKYINEELINARKAAEIVEAVRVDAGHHKEATARMRELDRERAEREKIRIEITKVEAAVGNVSNEQKRSNERLENALKAHEKLTSLRPLAVEQQKLEETKLTLDDSISEIRGLRSQLASMDEKLTLRREQYKKSKAEFDAAKARSASAEQTEPLQKQENEIVRKLAALNAALDRDRRFQQEIRNGLCPILSEKCLNLGEGETLEKFISTKFEEVQITIHDLESRSIVIKEKLQNARTAERFSIEAAALEKRTEEIKNEGTQLSSEKEAIEKRLADSKKIEAELDLLTAKLKKLDDPRTKIKFLENEISGEAELRQNITRIESNLERLENDKKILAEKLETYISLDEDLKQTAAKRDTTEEAYRRFIANETAATTIPEREKAASVAASELEEFLEELEAALRSVAASEANYNRDQHIKEKADLLDLQRSEAELSATIKSYRSRADELDAEIEKLTETRQTMLADLRKKERFEKIAVTTDFIRNILKEAAPLVARNYVYRVSAEANQMFREITGDPERTLKWGEDYGILLEEGGYERPFNGFSGGEQMAAALSVRLALLKQMTDIRIAFFDEPTTNMDAERRENLAEQISRVGHFDQLFIISHDDTFEEYVDNNVVVEKENRT